MATSDNQNQSHDLMGNGMITSSHDDNLHQSCSSNKYKGVRKRKWGKWVSEIRLPNSRERIWLGSYDTAQKAARAFDAALYCLRGPRAHFNFPDTPLEFDNIITLPHAHQSLSPNEIQELAARFANHANQNDQLEVRDPPVLLPSAPNSSDRVTETENSGGTGFNMYDWSFLNSLDSGINNDEVNFNYSNLHINNDTHHALYSVGLDKMHSGELYPTPTSPPHPFLMDHANEEAEGEDALSHQSLFLWNF